MCKGSSSASINYQALSILEITVRRADLYEKQIPL